MSLKKEIVIDLIQILEDGSMQIRQATKIKENGKEIGKTYHRHCIMPGDNIDKENAKVKNVANVLWTAEVINTYKEKLITQNITN